MSEPWFPEHAWVAVAVPAGAQRLRVAGADLAATLRDAGATLVAGPPLDAGTAVDMEIADGGPVVSDAAWVAVHLLSPTPEGGLRAVRAARRLVRATALQVHAHRVSRQLCDAGFGHERLLRYDLERWQDPLRGGWRAGRALPLRAVIVAGRGDPAPTLADAVVDEAARVDPSLRHRPVLLRSSGIALVVGDATVLRVAVGPARRQLDDQRANLAVLGAVAPTEVTRLLPRVLARERTGLADWSLESRLPGTRGAALTPPLMADCLDVLVALAELPGGPSAGAHVSRDAAVVAATCGPGDAQAVQALGRRLERSLEGLAGRQSHGDFWAANLLVGQGRLSGVIDWAGARMRPPVLDLFHLQVVARCRPGWHLGRAILRYLFPMARAGGDEAVRAYCRRVGIDPGAQGLVDLAIAYWLDRVAQELGTYADRAARPAWLQENVGTVLATLVGAGLCGA